MIRASDRCVVCSRSKVKVRFGVVEFYFTSISGPGSGVWSLGSGVSGLGSGSGVSGDRGLKNWNPKDDPPK